MFTLSFMNEQQRQLWQRLPDSNDRSVMSLTNLSGPSAAQIGMSPIATRVSRGDGAKKMQLPLAS